MDREPASAKSFIRCPECLRILPHHTPQCSLYQEARRKLIKLGVLASAGAVAAFLVGRAQAIPAPSTNSIVEPGSMTAYATYLIYQDGSTVLARNGKTGANDFSRSDGDVAAILQSVHDGLPSGGQAEIMIKEGTYSMLTTLSISKPAISIVGTGRDATILQRQVDNLATDCVDVSAAAVGFRMEHLQLGTFSSSTFRCLRVLDVLNGGTSLFINDCKIWGANSGNTRFAQADTIRINSGGPLGNYIVNSNIRGGLTNALQIGSLADDNFMANLILTTAAQDGLLLNSTQNCQISNIIADSNNNGIHATSSQNITISGGRMSRNNQDGILIDGGTPSDIIILGVRSHDNSQSPVQTYSGIEIQAGTQNTIIKACRAFNTGGGTTQKNGILLNNFGSGNLAKVILEGNLVTPNATAGIAFIDTGTTVMANIMIRDTMGYQPVGIIASPFDNTNNRIGVLGSSGTLTSAKIYTCVAVGVDIYLAAGTVSAMTKNGSSIPYNSTLTALHLEPGDTFSITFTVIPTTVLVSAY